MGFDSIPGYPPFMFLSSSCCIVVDLSVEQPLRLSGVLRLFPGIFKISDLTFINPTFHQRYLLMIS